MAVMTDVREAAQNLIEYAIHRSMIGQDDRIWAYNTILECIGATGPALDMAWALKTEKISLLHPDTLPDFDLEGTLAALSEAAVTNGAAEDTASGRDRIAMRIMGALMPRPSVVNEEFNGRMGVNEPPCRDRLVLRPVLRRRLRAPCRHRAQHQMEHPHQLGQS